MIKTVIFDADKTLWDHYNISEFEEPLKVINETQVEDSNGNKLTLFPSVKETLKELKKRGIIVGMATWNFPHKTTAVLKALELEKYFDIIISRDYPFKFIMITEILNNLRYEKNISIKPEEVLFVDDRRIHFGNVWLYLGNVKCVEMWKDIHDHKEIFSFIN
ncbi:magnesium-dependent phosphatase-1 [Acidianus sp. RZ1]|uniref:magnesium-dependent phosphatase-1 n=1 Tax=Acidianus sp. RZ1 TaxID=1540082 RepID=UPI0014911DE8|nr:magnesium-dependent phosphatase-1 [Acidianus sp. RZ1]NON62588.1 magnesium-dependent phosphatase-1 [Acidianus sp. RZ1]